MGSNHPSIIDTIIDLFHEADSQSTFGAPQRKGKFPRGPMASSELRLGFFKPVKL